MNVRSVHRAVDVLQTLAQSERPLGLGELCRAVGAPKSTLWTIVRTLAARGCVAVDDGSGRYRLGPLLAELAARARQGVDLRALARPHLERLNRETREAVLLHVPDGDEVLCLERVDCPQPIRYVAEVGSRRPLHCTAAGKLVLALAPPSFVTGYVRRTRLRPCSPRTIRDPSRLRRELLRIRRLGYAVSLGEHTADLMGVAAPVLGEDGRLVASLNVAGPIFRLKARLAELAVLVTRTAREVTREYARYGGALATR